MDTVVVQLSEHPWTMAALHLACGLARRQNAQVALLWLIPVPHPAWLGTPFGMMSMTPQEHRSLREYMATAEDYGVEFFLQPMQYISLREAIIQAAEHLNAQVVFANLPRGAFSWWRDLQIRSLEQQLSARNRRLYTLDSRPMVG